MRSASGQQIYARRKQPFFLKGDVPVYDQWTLQRLKFDVLYHTRGVRTVYAAGDHKLSSSLNQDRSRGPHLCFSDFYGHSVVVALSDAYKLPAMYVHTVQRKFGRYDPV